MTAKSGREFLDACFRYKNNVPMVDRYILMRGNKLPCDLRRSIKEINNRDEFPDDVFVEIDGVLTVNAVHEA
jgi:hypothetical protein